jgi:uroporphyrinogen decarboxylase
MPLGKSVSLDIDPTWRKPDFDRYFEDIEIPSDGRIGDTGVLRVPGSSYHFTRRISPLRNAVTLAEIEDFPYPDPDRYVFDDAGLAKEVEEAHAGGMAVSAFCGHIYEDAWQIRGYEQFLMDLHSRPENCQYILEKIAERNMALAQAFARAKIDVLHTADDVANQNAMMFAPGIWRKYMKPVWARIIARAKEIHPKIEIYYHSDGNIMEVIPDLIEIGVTILDPVQPECLDIIEVKKLYGKHLVFHGTIGTQTTMPFGTPEEVRHVVRQRKGAVGFDGALILAPTHVLEPEVPIENIIAFLDEC